MVFIKDAGYIILYCYCLYVSFKNQDIALFIKFFKNVYRQKTSVINNLCIKKGQLAQNVLNSFV